MRRVGDPPGDTHDDGQSADHDGGAGGVDGGMILTLESGQLPRGAVVEVVRDQDPAAVRELTGCDHGGTVQQ